MYIYIYITVNISIRGVMVPSKNNVDILTQDPYFVLYTSSRVKIISFTNPYLKTSNINMKKSLSQSIHCNLYVCFQWLTIQSVWSLLGKTISSALSLRWLPRV